MAKTGITRIAHELMGEVAANARATAGSMAWPDHMGGTRQISHAEEVRMVREMALADPGYLARKLDEIAPKVIKGPDGQLYRPLRAMVRFEKLVQEALPEVVALHALQEGS